MVLTDISYKRKHLAILTIPILFFLWFSISSISQSISTTREMLALTQVTNLSVVYSELVHELQKERGMTAVFIGSQGKRFANQLNTQRTTTDLKIAHRARYWQDNAFKQEEIRQLNDAINQTLNQLDDIRQQVNTKEITLAQALAYYTNLNAELLSLSGINAEISSDATTTKETIAYYNFLQATERAGIERAILSNAFAKGQLTDEMLVKFITLVTEQDTYFANFSTFASVKNKAFFSQQLNSPSIKEVVRLRHIAATQRSQLEVNPEYWFKQSTARIEQLSKIERRLGVELLELAKSTKDSAFNSILLNIIISALLIFLTAAILAWKTTEKKLRVLADFEPLTNLTNRRSFIEQLELALQKPSNKEHLSVLFIDLDYFKSINDVYGHETGDLLLEKVAKRMQQEVDGNALLSRYGGDEFTLLLPDTTAAHTQLMATRIQRCFQRFFTLQDHVVNITASIGVATYPEAGTDAKLLMRHANQAMHAAKNTGRNVISFHDAELQRKYQYKLELKERLKVALDQNQLSVFYQPVVDIKSNKVAKFEALVRWPDGYGGYISPGVFIPIAEQFGLIHLVGNFVFKQACTDLKALHQQGFKDICFSINRSISELCHGELVQQSITEVIKEAGLPYDSIVVEITESTAMSENQYAKQALAQLKSKGIKVALDDFCTGYSSLNYLLDYDVDIIKIDRSFVKALEHDSNSKVLTATVIDLANKLGIEVIAEGVENDHQLEFLSQSGCRYIQGFYYSPAVPISECYKLLERQVSYDFGKIIDKPKLTSVK